LKYCRFIRLYTEKLNSKSEKAGIAQYTYFRHKAR
jgi:hypothetical protein